LDEVGLDNFHNFESDLQRNREQSVEQEKVSEKVNDGVDKDVLFGF
jgi:hypothetical protein